MNNLVLNGGDVVYYVVCVNGQEMSQRVESKMLAEMEKQKLDESLRSIAEVVPVTADGKQILLG